MERNWRKTEGNWKEIEKKEGKLGKSKSRASHVKVNAEILTFLAGDGN